MLLLKRLLNSEILILTPLFNTLVSIIMFIYILLASYVSSLISLELIALNKVTIPLLALTHLLYTCFLITNNLRKLISPS
jgi:phage-related protein